MAITSLDQLVDAVANRRQKIPFGKSANIGTQVIGGNSSAWRVNGLPAAGNIPTAAAACDNTTVGGINFVNPSGGMSTHVARMNVSASGVCNGELHDRLAHMGGLSGTVTTAQTVGLDLHTTGLGNTSNITARKGQSSFIQVQWYLEWYATTGTTAVTATIAVVYDDGSTGNTVVSIPASTNTSRMIPILPGVAGRNIRAVTSVTLSATTGTAGNFGVTATRQITEFMVPVLNFSSIMNWADTGLPVVEDSACLFFVLTSLAATCQTPSSGAVTLVQG